MSTGIEKYLVGGAVRDRLLGQPVTERDWVVVGATPEQMRAAGFRPVGQDFPVFIEPATGEEHALARTERKSGRGYGGFVFHASPDITLEQDLQRRDLTVNAMAEAADGRLIDPYGGQRDLQARILRHVSPAFAEDPLRVLRVARFAARYADLGFRVAPETLELMRGLAESGELLALTPERSWKEISRALLETRPGIFFDVLERCGAVQPLFPELLGLYAAPSPTPGFARRSDFQLAVLEQAAHRGLSLPGRWSALLQGLCDAPAPGQTGEAAVRALNARYRVPKDCGELATLSCTHLPAFRQALELGPVALLRLFKAMDIYRRPDRFELFLEVAETQQQLEPDLADTPRQGIYLRGAAQAVRDVAVEPLLARGLAGAELGQALERARMEALVQYGQLPH